MHFALIAIIFAAHFFAAITLYAERNRKITKKKSKIYTHCYYNATVHYADQFCLFANLFTLPSHYSGL